MKISKTGFTLIELLVVILIIGILAAIALPQYQKTILKSKYASYKSLGKSLAEAEELYYLEHNKYTVDINNLDISFSEQPLQVNSTTGRNIYNFHWGKVQVIDRRFEPNEPAPRILVSPYSEEIFFEEWLPRENTGFPTLAGKQVCHSTSDLANTICQQETRKTQPTQSNQYGKRYTYP